MSEHATVTPCGASRPTGHFYRNWPQLRCQRIPGHDDPHAACFGYSVVFEWPIEPKVDE